MRESIFKKSVTYMEFCRNFAILKHFCSIDNFLEGLFSIGQHFESTSTLFSDIGLVFIALLKSPNEEKISGHSGSLTRAEKLHMFKN